MPYLNDADYLGSEASVIPLQKSTYTLGAGGEYTATGLVGASTGNISLTMIGTVAEDGVPYVVSRTSTTVLIRSTAGYKHAGVQVLFQLS